METTEITESTIVETADYVTSTEVDRERILLDLQDGIYYGLNPTGAQIWTHVQKPTSVSTVVTAIVEKYDIDYDQGLKDVVTLLQNLEEKNLIVVRDEMP
jgi:hypothetical protein